MSKVFAWAFNLSGSRRTSVRDKMISLRQLAVLLGAGVPLLRSLEVLDQRGVPEMLRLAWRAVLRSVMEGQSLARAMASHSGVFNLLEIGMVRAAERSSHLASTLRYLADLLEGEYKLKRAITGALHYPMFLLTASLLGLTLFTVNLMPVFTQGLSVELKLPWLTRCLLGVAGVLGAPVFYTVLLAVAPLGIWLAAAYLRSPQGRYRWQKWQLSAYCVGRILKKALLTRFCQTFAVLLRTGMPLPLCLDVAGDALGNYQLAEAVRTVNDGIKNGCTLGEAFAASPFFPRLIANMLEISEEAGTPADALDYVSKIYDRQVSLALEQFVQLLEPIMLLLIGVFMALMLLGMFLPLYQNLSVL